MKITNISHVAYRCTNAAETVEFYKKNLGLKFSFAIAENKVPSTGEHFPHIHIFLEVSSGTYLGFFELSEADTMTFDKNTPSWVQHLAFGVSSVEDVQAFRDRLVDQGVEVLGVTDHGVFKSIYFFDPSGHRIEITCETMSPQVLARLEREAESLLDHWNEHKRAPDVGWHRESAVLNAAHKSV